MIKNGKICFNKSVGIIIAVVIALGIFAAGAAQLSQMSTSTSSRASSCAPGKDMGGGMYQCQANCGASKSGKCYKFVHNSPDQSCTQCNGLPSTATQTIMPTTITQNTIVQPTTETSVSETVEPTGSSMYIPSSSKDVRISVWKIGTDPKGKLVPQTVQGNTVSLNFAAGKKYFYKNNYFACLHYVGTSKIDTYADSVGGTHHYALGTLRFSNEDESSVVLTEREVVDELMESKYLVWPADDTAFCKVISIKGLGSRTLTGKYGATIGGSNVSFVPADLIIQVN